MAKLEEYDYTVVYNKGKANTNADVLSRIEIHSNETLERLEDDTKFDTASLINYLPSVDDPLGISTDEHPATFTQKEKDGIINEILDLDEKN